MLETEEKQVAELREENLELRKSLFRAHDDYLTLQARFNESEEAVRVLSVALGVFLLVALIGAVVVLKSGGYK